MFLMLCNIDVTVVLSLPDYDLTLPLVVCHQCFCFPLNSLKNGSKYGP